MDVKVKRKGFYKIIKAIFEDIAEIEEGYPVLVPIWSNHQIYINDIMIFLDKNKKHYLSVNKYGQLSIETEEEEKKVGHIHFNLEKLNSISFLTLSITGEINENNGMPYNERYRFKLY